MLTDAAGLQDYSDFLEDAQLSFSQLFWIRDILQSNDIFGDTTKGEEFCALSRDVLGETLSNLVCSAEPLNDCSGLPTICGADIPPPECEELDGDEECTFIETEEQAALRFQSALEEAVQAWKDECQSEIAQLGDPQDALNAAIAPALDEIPREGNGLAQFVSMVSARHRFQRRKPCASLNPEECAEPSRRRARESAQAACQVHQRREHSSHEIQSTSLPHPPDPYLRLRRRLRR